MQTPSRQRGFTLIELILVIVILGVLAVVAAPRIFHSSDIYARGFHDETLALLRYAQKAAVAQRRTVCVTFDTVASPNTLVLTMENPAGTGNVSCTVDVVGPKGDSPATVRARSGTSYTSATNFFFDGLGQPTDNARAALGAAVVIAIANAGPITVEAQTGYVHD
ncbi:MAG: type II secretion system protein [Rhodoferax sp.]|nr:type II secretion system protein [Rhodoferax sp.]